MEKTIKISGLDCTFRTSAAIPRIYRIKFKRDIFADMSKLEREIKRNKNNKAHKSEIPFEALEIFENIAFIMHRHGDPSQPKDIVEWLDQFETFDIYEVFPEIFEMWVKENQHMSTPKKK